MILEMPAGEPWMRQDPPKEMLGEPWQFLADRLGKWAERVREATATATRDGWAGDGAQATSIHNGHDEDNIQELQRLCGQASTLLTGFWTNWKNKSEALLELDRQFQSQVTPQDRPALETPFYIYKDANSTDKLPSGRDYQVVAATVERLKDEAAQKIRELGQAHDNTQQEFRSLKARIEQVTDVKDLGKTMGQIYTPGALASFSILNIRNMSDPELIRAGAAGRLNDQRFGNELRRLGQHLGDALNARNGKDGQRLVWTEDMAKAMACCGGQTEFTQPFLNSAGIDNIVAVAHAKSMSAHAKYFAAFLDNAVAGKAIRDEQIDEFIIVHAGVKPSSPFLDPNQLLNATKTGSPFAAAYLQRAYDLNKTDVFREKGLANDYQPWAVTGSMNLCLEKLNDKQQYDFFVGDDYRANVDVMRDFAVQAGYNPKGNGLNPGAIAHIFHKLAVADVVEPGKPVTQSTHASTSVAAAVIDIYGRKYTSADCYQGGRGYSAPGEGHISVSTPATRRIFTQMVTHRMSDVVAVFGGEHEAHDMPPGSVRFRTEADAYAPDSKVTSYPGVSKDQMRAFVGPLMTDKQSSEAIHQALLKRLKEARTPDSDPFSSKPGEFLRTGGELKRSALLAAEDRQQVLEDQAYNDMINRKAPSQVFSNVVSIIPAVGGPVDIVLDPVVSNSNDKMHRATDREWAERREALEKRHQSDAKKHLQELQNGYTSHKDEVDKTAAGGSRGIVSKEYRYPAEWENNDGLARNIDIRKSRSAGPHRQALTDAELKQEVEDRREQCDQRTNWREDQIDYSTYWLDPYLKKEFEEGYGKEMADR